MTRADWQRLMGKWCEILRIERPPRLVIVRGRDIPGCDALCEYYDALESGWTIKVRTGRHRDAELTMVHELLHVRSGCTDLAHEGWIRDVAAALVALERAGRHEA